MNNTGITLGSFCRVLLLEADPARCQRLHAVLAPALQLPEQQLLFAASAGAGLHMLMHEQVHVVIIGTLTDLQPALFGDEVERVWPWIQQLRLDSRSDDDAAAMLAVTAAVTRACEHWQRDLGPTLPLASVHQQFRILARLTEQGVQAESSIEALRSLSVGLAAVVDCSLVGFLSYVDERSGQLFLHLAAPVQADFVAAAKTAMLARFADFTGHHLTLDQLSVDQNGNALDSNGPSQICSLALVPICRQQRVQGMLCLAHHVSGVYNAPELLLLYHVAEYTNMVFAGLNRMRRLAITDPLTGLYNRLYVEETLNQAVEQQRRLGTAVSVVTLDLDHFKTVNDTYGHAVGDQVLKEFALLLQRTARKADIVGRYGGEEFIVVLPGQGAQGAISFGKRLLQLTREFEFCQQSHPLHITVSLGIASSFDSSDDEPASDKLLARADQALYLSKRRGRNQLRVWAEDVRPGQAALHKTSANGKLLLPRGHVLVVDDDAAIRDLLRRILEIGNYSVTLTDNGNDAVAKVAAEPEAFDLILSDICMPDKNGIDLLKELRSFDNTLVIIMMTGNARMDYALESLRHGAHDFIEKPFVAQHLLAVVRRAVEYRLAIKENCRYQVHLEELVRQKSHDLQQSFEAIKQSYKFTLEALAALLDARECESARHSMRVRDLCMILGTEMGLESTALQDLADGALLHDIGKIAVPDAILLKPGPLTSDEQAVMRRHCETGYRILGDSQWLANAAQLVHSHHERFDGSGYPRGLKGAQICLGARLFSVVDAYDAMRRDRVYRAAMSRQRASAEIVDNSGTQFDPVVVTAFLAVQDKIENYLVSIE